MNASEIVHAQLAYQVLEYRLENPEATVLEACKHVGITPRSFYRWVAEDNQAMEAVKDSLNAAQKGALFEYSQRLYTALTMLLDTAVNKDTKAETRLKVLKWVMPLMEEFAKVFHATPGGEDQAVFLKRGPVLEHGQSRLATVDLAVTEDGVRIDILQDEPVIELQARDPVEQKPPEPA